MADEDYQAATEPKQPIVFGARLAGSDAFKAMFREGMGLVEETASYLDGDGRADSRRLTRAGSLAYATESMRLTTRLMQLASWLLLQRAANEGEMSSGSGADREGQDQALRSIIRHLGQWLGRSAGEAAAPGLALHPVAGAHPAPRRCPRPPARAGGESGRAPARPPGRGIPRHEIVATANVRKSKRPEMQKAPASRGFGRFAAGADGVSCQAGPCTGS